MQIEPTSTPMRAEVLPMSPGRTRKDMAHRKGESLNTFFEVLEEWERHLAHLDFEGLERDDEPSGP